jgi:pilus assembly protein CpaF
MTTTHPSFEIIYPFIEPLVPLLTDPTVTEVMVNDGGRRVFVEREGRLELVPGLTITEEYLIAAIETIASFCGDDITPERPQLDGRLEDGSRIAAIIPPVAINGAVLTIRKFTQRYTLDELQAAGSMSPAASDVLRRAVRDKKNILISGGTGTGKTTLLNALAATIPDEERIFLIEETSEIHIKKPNLTALQARREQERLSAVTDVPAISIGSLLRSTLRHRPDRIILGEVRGAEAWDLLQALNTGHDGSLSTIHASSARKALVRLALCVLEAQRGLQMPSIQESIALAFATVVHVARVDGHRRVVEILALDGIDPISHKYQITSFTSVETGACA